MARFIKKQKHEIGVSPDELLFRGNQKTDEITLRIIDYDTENLEENAIGKVQEALGFQEKNSVTWLNVDGLHSPSIMEEISKGFNLDSLILAEVMNTETRPKVVEYQNCVFISIKMLQQNEETALISVENLSLIITNSVLISFQEKKGDVFEPVRERIRKQKKRIRNSGTDYLAFALLDVVIDNYIYVISVLGEKIESLEEDLAIEPKQSLINEINNYKRELNFLRKSIKPAEEMILALSKIESDLIDESSYIHFKELQDNINQASDSSDS